MQQQLRVQQQGAHQAHHAWAAASAVENTPTDLRHEDEAEGAASKVTCVAGCLVAGRRVAVSVCSGA